MNVMAGVPKWRGVVGLLLAVVALAGGAREAGAQSGVVRGQVTAEGGHDYLQGAQVTLQGTGYGARTNRTGQYRIEGVAPGRYTLVVQYLGYGDFRQPITVAPGGTVTQDVSLAAKAVVLDPLVVQVQQGQAKALNAQRTAATITNVVDEEQMEAFPDYNTAEVLQRVPGVNISRGMGEGKFVAIRGTEPRMTSVTVDGQKIATPEDEERFVALDVISSNQMSSVEVTKALTPEMDADAIGGTVNLVSRSAFDIARGNRQVRLNGAYGRSDLGGKPLYEGAVNYSQLFAGDRLGVSLNGSIRQRNQITHNDESNWGSVRAGTNTIPFALLDTELRRYFNQRDRYGLSGDVEFRPGAGESRFYLRGMFNKRDDYQNRHQSRFRVDRGTYQDATHVTGARLVRALQDRLETQYITNLAGGGEHALGGWKIDYTGAYTYGEQNKDKGQILPEFTLNSRVNMAIDLTDPSRPGFNITNQPQSYLDNPANYTLDQIDFRYETTSDREAIGALNLERQFSLGGNSGSFQFGGKVRDKRKDRNDQRWRYRWAGTGSITMDRFASNAVSERFLGGAYAFGPTIDNAKLREFFEQNRGTPTLREEENVQDSKGDAYDAGEGIVSGYAMGTLNLGRLMLLAGVRDERTRTDYSGTRLTSLGGGRYEITDLNDERTYNHLFPSFHARLAATERTNLRFAFTSGIARANFFDLVPYLWILPESRQILRGNSELTPTHSNNLDLMAEHYFRSIGVISGGLFYKDLHDIIYTRRFQEPSGQYQGYNVEEPVNGGNAKLYGYEVNWQQQLTFLPSFLRGFGIYANYTYSKSEADLLYREWSTLPGQASDAGNLAVSYDLYGLTARLSMNYSGRFISEVGASPAEDQIVADHTQWDFSSSFAVNRNTSIFLNVQNLTNEPQRIYLGDPSRPRQTEFYSWSSDLGLKVRF